MHFVSTTMACKRGLLWALCVAACGSIAWAEDELAASLHTGVGRGDFEFIVDAAALQRAGEGRVLTRVLVQLPVRSLLDLTKKNAADVNLRVRAYDLEQAFAALGEGLDDSGEAREQANAGDRLVLDLLEQVGGLETLAEVETRHRVETQDRSRLADTDYQLLEAALELPPGDYVVDVVVENLSKLKRGILDRMRGKATASLSRIVVRVPDLHAPVAVADPVFLSGHIDHHPYPSRMYGLLNDSLHVRTTVFASGDTRIHLVAHDRDAEVHWSDSLQVRVDGQRVVEFHASVNSLPAGQYVLSLRAESDTLAAVARRSFDVAWSLVTWNRSRRDLDIEAAILLTENEYEVFRSLPVGEKERFMDEFWASQDPSPDTAYNEVLEEFRRRVAYADTQFSETRRGALSDRGKVYIRFGPPNEIQAEAVPGHLAGSGTEDLLTKIDDPYSAVEHNPVREDLHGSGGTLQGQRARRNVRSEHARVVGPARELIAYELWIYAGGGSRLLEERDVVGLDAGLRLLFVDTQGFGAYVLRKSSAKLPIVGLGATF